MSENLAQIYATNPTTTVNDNDLFYLVQNSGNTDAGIHASDLKNYINLTQSLTPVPVTASTKTLGLSDSNTLQEMNSVSAQTLSIPPNSSVAFPVGTIIYVNRVNSGVTSIAPGAGVTITDPNNGNLTLNSIGSLGLLIQSDVLDTWKFFPLTSNYFKRVVNILDPNTTGSPATLPSSTQLSIAGSLTGSAVNNTIYSRISFSNSNTFTTISKWIGSGYTSTTGSEFGALGYIAGGSSIVAYQWFMNTGTTPSNPLHTWYYNGSSMTLTENGTLTTATFSGNISGTSGVFSGVNYTAQQTLTDAASITWNAATQQNATVTLGGNRTLANPTNLAAGETMILKVIQDATGSRTLAYGAAYKWPGGSAPVLSTTANAVDILSFYTDGTNIYGAAQIGFS